MYIPYPALFEESDHEVEVAGCRGLGEGARCHRAVGLEGVQAWAVTFSEVRGAAPTRGRRSRGGSTAAAPPGVPGIFMWTISDSTGKGVIFRPACLPT